MNFRTDSRICFVAYEIFFVIPFVIISSISIPSQLNVEVVVCVSVICVKRATRIVGPPFGL